MTDLHFIRQYLLPRGSQVPNFLQPQVIESRLKFLNEYE